jgi:hypothetical protein
MGTHPRRLDLRESTKLLSEWAVKSRDAAKEYAKTMPADSIQEATSLALVRAIEDLVTVESDMQRLAERFFSTLDAVKTCGNALELEFGERFINKVPSPQVIVVCETTTKGESECACPCCRDLDEPPAKGRLN